MKRRFEILKNAYKGETAYLFSCGPSFRPEEITTYESKLKGSLIVVVKQAQDQLGAFSDFHLINAINHKKYKYSRDTIICMSKPFNPDAWPVLGPKHQLECQADASFAGLSRDETKSQWLVKTKEFAKYKFDTTLTRPWGPSIIIEIGLYLLLHMGVKKVVCVGWDVTPPNTNSMTMTHFYENKTDNQNSIKERLYRILLKLNHIFAPVEWHRRNSTALCHYFGRIYNVCSVEPEENPAIWDASYDLYQFFRSEGMEIRLASTKSYLSPRIPRTSLADELGLL